MQQSYEQTLTIFRSFGASAIAQLSVPVYQGGAEYSLIRQSKETLAQQRLNLEQIRDQTRANVGHGMGPAGGRQGAGRSRRRRRCTASEIALNGVREEAKAGQRTTLDVLNAQQALVNARVALVTAQHDRVVASYAVLNAVGRLSPQVLEPADDGLRSERALSSGARQLGRRSHARRPLIRHVSLRTLRETSVARRHAPGACLQSIVAMTYLCLRQQSDSRRVVVIRPRRFGATERGGSLRGASGGA